MIIHRKLKIYFDSTILSYLFADDTPAKKDVTKMLWEHCMAGDFEIFVSQVFFREIDNTPQPKLSKMIEKLGLIEYKVLEETDEVIDLARSYVNNGLHTERRMDDCIHIAQAVVEGCDCILSWNQDDFTKDRIRNGVKVVNAINRYKEIWILAPDEFLKGGYK